MNERFLGLARTDQDLRPIDEFYRDGYSTENVTRHSAKRINIVLALLRNRKEQDDVETLLDVGCSVGKFTQMLKDELAARRVFGLEVSEIAVAEARERGVEVSKCNVDTDPFPYEDDTFELVLALELLEHLFDPEHCLTEIARVTKRNGFFVVSTPNLASWHGRISLCLGYMPLTLDAGLRRHYGSLTNNIRAPGHVRNYTYRALAELLDSCGFKVLAVRSCPLELRCTNVWRRVFATIDSIASKFPSIGSDMVILAQRR